jgi:hypothetical protein
LGSGSIAAIPVLPASYQPLIFFILPPGGFFVFALFIALNLFIKSKLKAQTQSASASGQGCEECPSASCCGIPENSDMKSVDMKSAEGQS